MNLKTNQAAHAALEAQANQKEAVLERLGFTTTASRREFMRRAYRAGFFRGALTDGVWGLLIGMVIVCVLVQWPDLSFRGWP